MDLEVTVWEVIALIKELKNVPAKTLGHTSTDIRKGVGTFLTGLTDQGVTQHLGREKCKGKEDVADYSKSRYARTFFIKDTGDMRVRIPGGRNENFQSQVLLPSQYYDKRIAKDIAARYLTGISMRNLSLLGKRFIRQPLCPAKLSNVTIELKPAVEKWRVRDLFRERIESLFSNGVKFHMGTEGHKDIPEILANVKKPRNKSILHAVARRKLIE